MKLLRKNRGCEKKGVLLERELEELRDREVPDALNNNSPGNHVAVFNDRGFLVAVRELSRLKSWY